MLRTPTAPTQPTTPTSGIGERVAQPWRRSRRVDDLGVLVDEHERLEVVAVGDRVHDQVVAAEDRARRRRWARTSESGSAARRIPRLRARAGTCPGSVIEQPKTIIAAPASGAAMRRSPSGGLGRLGSTALAQRPPQLALELELLAPSARAGSRRRADGARGATRRRRVERRRSAARARAASARRSQSTCSSGSVMPCSARNSSTARRQPVERAVVVDHQVAAGARGPGRGSRARARVGS